VLLVALGVAANAQTQAELNEQAKKEYLAADKELGRYLEKIAPTLSQSERERLQLAQNAWTAYRDAAAASESAFYSQGSAQTLVHYTVMKDLTAERLQRLKRMMEDVEPSPAPASDPQAALDKALTSEAVATDMAELKEVLQTEDEAKRYLDVVVPAGKALVDALEQQKLNPDYLTWIRNHPEQGREIVQFAAALALEERSKKDSKGFNSDNMDMVTKFIQVEGNKGGFLDSQLGQIASEFTIRPLPPYRLYTYLIQEGGLKERTESYIASKIQP
jgi:uncharacterized protein YecT (DUF1311 family)